MTADFDLDRQLGAWLGDQTVSQPPADLLARSLARVGRTGQRPGWAVRDRVVSPHVGLLPAFMPAWLIVLAFALAAVALVAAGSYLFDRQLSVISEPSPATSPSAPESVPTSPLATLTPAVSPRWTAIPPMIQIRYGESATLLPDGRVLIAGGDSEWGAHGLSRTSAELFDPMTAGWSLTGDLLTGRSRHGAVRLADGRVLVVGGISSTSSSGSSGDAILASAEIYDPALGTWSGTSSMRVPRLDPTVTLLRDGRVLVAGGVRSGDATAPEASAEMYDPTQRTWAQVASMAVARTAASAALLLDGRVMVAGGGCCGQPALASVELFDPATETWSTTGRLAHARRWLTTVVLLDGRVLALGGDDNGVAVSSAEIFDPVTARWSPKKAPGSAIQAVVLRDGRVLMKGFADGEVYDPATETWSSVDGPIEPRVDQTLTLLNDGRVLLTYGEQAAIFDPNGGP